MWPIFQQVVASGTTYVFAPDTSYADACAYWFGPGISSYVAVEDEHIVGMYKIVANQRDLRPATPADRALAVLVASWLGTTRLIDNVEI